MIHVYTCIKPNLCAPVHTHKEINIYIYICTSVCICICYDIYIDIEISKHRKRDTMMHPTADRAHHRLSPRLPPQITHSTASLYICVYMDTHAYSCMYIYTCMM